MTTTAMGMDNDVNVMDQNITSKSHESDNEDETKEAMETHKGKTSQHISEEGSDKSTESTEIK